MQQEPIRNLGIEPFTSGVNAGVQLRNLALQEAQARRLEDEARYTRDKRQQTDQALREVLGDSSKYKTANEVLNAITASAQKSPEAAVKAYELLKVLSPTLKAQLAKEQMAQKVLESKLKTQQAIDEAVGKESATLPLWTKKEGIKHDLGLESDANKNLLDFTKQAELEKLKSSYKPEKPPKAKHVTRTNSNGEQETILVDSNDEGLVLGVMKPGESDWTFTDKYVPWLVGNQASSRLMNAINNDASIPADKKNEAAIKLIREGKAADYLVSREQKTTKPPTGGTASSTLPQSSQSSGAVLNNLLPGNSVLGTEQFGGSPLRSGKPADTSLVRQAPNIPKPKVSPGQLEQAVQIPTEGAGQSNPFDVATMTAPRSLSQYLINQQSSDPTSIGGVNDVTDIPNQIATTTPSTEKGILESLWETLTKKQNAFASPYLPK